MNSSPAETAAEGDQTQRPDDAVPVSDYPAPDTETIEGNVQEQEGDTDEEEEEQEVETTSIIPRTGAGATVNGETEDVSGDHFGIRIVDTSGGDGDDADVEENQDQVDPIRSEEDADTGAAFADAGNNEGDGDSVQEEQGQQDKDKPDKTTDDDGMEIDTKERSQSHGKSIDGGNNTDKEHPEEEIRILDVVSVADSTTTNAKNGDGADLPDLLLDLELECVDEDLAEEQLQKAKNLSDNFRQMLRDVARIKKKQQRILTNNKVGSQLIGVQKVSLVRPAQQQQQMRFQQPQHQRIPTPTAAAGYQPRIINRGQQPFGGMQGVAPQPQQLQFNPQGGPIQQIIRSTAAGGPPLQPLIFDATSGLLIMPAATGAPPPVTSVVRPFGHVPPPIVSMAGAGAGAVAMHQQVRMRQVQPRYSQSRGQMPHPQAPRVQGHVPMASRAMPTRVQPLRAPLSLQRQPHPHPQVGRMPSMGTATRHPIRQATPGPARFTATQAQEKRDDSSKTFPSLVVNVKPCLQDKPSKVDLQRGRADLDSRVKTLLIHTPSKFTEWLMQRGLLRLEHKCTLHQSEDGLPVQYKLGMYSDGNKQPFSGGYVWISECCPEKQISVFQGSIFEASVYPPGTLFKLIYHWSCQTSATNVLQWVKVTSYYLKNFYTLLRSACVAALHELSPELGGPRKYVEVGIITLGTSMPSNSKQVKVEILGVFDPSTKAIRLKVVNPQNNPHSTRVQQILWPLRHWVHKESVLLIDSGIEKGLIMEMGFANVVQCSKTAGAGGSPTNVNVMNYLKHIVPKMFQNTLCVLSKSLIQQFLDELSWRELWGRSAGECFDNIVGHLVQMTKWEMGEPLITRLNKISLNPFGEWSYNRHRRPGIDMLPESILHDIVHEEESPTMISSLSGGSGSIRQTPFIPNLSNGGATGALAAAAKRKQTPAVDPAATLREQHDRFAQLIRTEPRTLYVHSYYYAESIPKNIVPPAGLFPANLKCPLCSKQFLNNLEVIKHIAGHVNSLGVRQGGGSCEYCLKDVGGTGAALHAHVHDCHKLTGGGGGAEACLICCERFTSPSALILHMWENHCQQDMPYKCELCSYKSSFHYEAVDHFTREHKGYDSVLCPHCLKVMSARSFSCLKGIVVHMQSHSIRRGKKCGHCVLVFTSDAEYRVHLAEGVHQEPGGDAASAGHITTTYQNEDLDLKMPSPPPRIHSLPPPLKKPRQEEPGKTLNVYKPAMRLSDDGRTQIEDFRSKYLLPMGLPDCIECGLKMNTSNHFPSFASCIKCRFSTSCGKSMEEHLRRVHFGDGSGELRPALSIKSAPQLKFDLECDCGFGTRAPVQMASHLVKCEKYTCKSDVVWGEEEQFMERIGLTAK